jgi:hypothetical protein
MQQLTSVCELLATTLQLLLSQTSKLEDLALTS